MFKVNQTQVKLHLVQKVCREEKNGCFNLCVCVCVFGPGRGLLGVGGDLNGELDALLQGVSGPLVDGLHRLDVHAADHQVVLVEAQTGPDCQLLIEAKHS